MNILWFTSYVLEPAVLYRTTYLLSPFQLKLSLSYTHTNVHRQIFTQKIVSNTDTQFTLTLNKNSSASSERVCLVCVVCGWGLCVVCVCGVCVGCVWCVCTGFKMNVGAG